MNNLNSVLIGGNLTQDPQCNTLASGKHVCNFNLASNRYYRNSEKELTQDVVFIDVETWDDLALTCGEHLTKGLKVRVIGRLKLDRWQDEEGKNREKMRIVAEHVEFKVTDKEIIVEEKKGKTKKQNN